MTLKERYDAIKLQEDTHSLHLEDSLLKGPEYVERMINFLNHALSIVEGSSDASQPRPTVKWDGAPAITMWTSYPDFPGPAVSTKSVFNVNPKFYQSDEDIDADSRSPELQAKLKTALKLAQQSIIPPNQIWQGDLLWTQGDQKTHIEDGEKLVYVQPNTIVYAAPADSDLGQRIANSEIGIVFHTRYNENRRQSNDTKVEELNNVPSWAFVIDARLPDLSGKVSMSKKDSDGLKNSITELEKRCEKILAHDSYEELVRNDDFIQFYFMTLQNHKVDKGEEIEPEIFVEELHDWITTKMRRNYMGLDKLKTKKGRDNKRLSIKSTSNELHYLVNENQQLIQDIADGLYWASYIKGILIDQFNKSNEWMTKVQTRSSGMKTTSGEGFVVSDNDGNFVKLVDRSAFSMFNRSADIVKGFETKTRISEQENFISEFLQSLREKEELNLLQQSAIKLADILGDNFQVGIKDAKNENNKITIFMENINKEDKEKLSKLKLSINNKKNWGTFDGFPVQGTGKKINGWIAGQEDEEIEEEKITNITSYVQDVQEAIVSYLLERRLFGAPENIDDITHEKSSLICKKTLSSKNYEKFINDWSKSINEMTDDDVIKDLINIYKGKNINFNNSIVIHPNRNELFYGVSAELGNEKRNSHISTIQKIINEQFSKSEGDDSERDSINPSDCILIPKTGWAEATKLQKLSNTSEYKNQWNNLLNSGDVVGISLKKTKGMAHMSAVTHGSPDLNPEYFLAFRCGQSFPKDYTLQNISNIISTNTGANVKIFLNKENHLKSAKSFITLDYRSSGTESAGFQIVLHDSDAAGGRGSDSLKTLLKLDPKIKNLSLKILDNEIYSIYNQSKGIKDGKFNSLAKNLQNRMKNNGSNISIEEARETIRQKYSVEDLKLFTAADKYYNYLTNGNYEEVIEKVFSYFSQRRGTASKKNFFYNLTRFISYACKYPLVYSSDDKEIDDDQSVYYLKISGRKSVKEQEKDYGNYDLNNISKFDYKIGD